MKSQESYQLECHHSTLHKHEPPASTNIPKTRASYSNRQGFRIQDLKLAIHTLAMSCSDHGNRVECTFIRLHIYGQNDLYFFYRPQFPSHPLITIILLALSFLYLFPIFLHPSSLLLFLSQSTPLHTQLQEEQPSTQLYISLTYFLYLFFFLIHYSSSFIPPITSLFFSSFLFPCL